MIQFFEGWFFRNIITHKVFRWFVIVFFTCLTATSIFYATKLEANEEQVKVWRSDSNWNEVRKLQSNAFRKSQEDRVMIVHVIWGLKEQDRSKCHHTDFKCKGKTVLDQQFDMNSQDQICQHALLNFCKSMKNVSSGEEQKLRLRRSQVTGDIEMECIFQNMERFFKEESNKTIYHTSVTFPLDEKKVNALITANPDIYADQFVDNISRSFEVGTGYFLTRGGMTDYTSSYTYKTYKDLVGGIIYPHTLNNNTRDNRLIYVAVTFNTTVDPSQFPYKEGLQVYDHWESFINQKMNRLPRICSKGFQTTVKPYNVWQWKKVQKILVNNAITGIVIGLLCSLLVLTLATANVIIGVMATITIAMVTSGVLAIISIAGWSLGILESLNLTLIVGLAVDYVVHLAEGYMTLKDDDRVTRVKYTLGHVGISVTSGAFTTLGASVFMLAAKILFFSQFGIFVFCTIAFSILYSLFFFTTVLSLVGPEGNTGSLRPILRSIVNFICCKLGNVKIKTKSTRENKPKENVKL